MSVRCTAYNGQITFKAAPKTDQNAQGTTIVDGIKKVVHQPFTLSECNDLQMKSDPLTFSAISYQSEMLDWTQDQQSYTLYYRSPESKVMPKEASKEAAYTFLRAKYQVCAVFVQIFCELIAIVQAAQVKCDNHTR